MYLIGSSSSQLILSLGEPSFYPWIWLQTLTSISTLSPSLETDLTLNVPLNYREMQHLFISLNHLHFSQLLVVVPQIVFLNPSLSPIISLHTSVRVILIQYVQEITALPSQTFSSLWSCPCTLQLPANFLTTSHHSTADIFLLVCPQGHSPLALGVHNTLVRKFFPVFIYCHFLSFCSALHKQPLFKETSPDHSI